MNTITPITDNCKTCRSTDCVAVCPVTGLHDDKERGYIDPNVYINRSACIPASPIQAFQQRDPSRSLSVKKMKPPTGIKQRKPCWTFNANDDYLIISAMHEDHLFAGRLVSTRPG